MKLEIYGDKKTGFFGSGEYERGVDISLKPCPWCASNNVTIKGSYTPVYWGECQQCMGYPRGPTGYPDSGCTGPAFTETEGRKLHTQAFNNAVNAWNSRLEGN